MISKYETRMLILMFQRLLMLSKWNGRLLEDRYVITKNPREVF